MSFREFIKKIAFPLLDDVKYLERNVDVIGDSKSHYYHYGFDEARQAYFTKHEKADSQLLPELEIQYLRSQNNTNVSLITEFFNGAPSPCSYIRIIFPFQFLEFLNEVVIDESPRENRIWVLNRVPYFISGLEDWIKSIMPNDRILYDIDDDLISHYGEFSENTKLIILLILVADRVTVSTRELHKKLSKYSKNISIRRNFPMFDLTSKAKDYEGVFSILFMGTPTHRDDFKVVNNALEEIKRKYPKVVIRVIGLDDFTNNYNFNTMGIINNYYPKFSKDYNGIGHYKLGIIPLQEKNKINESKSSIKYYDYLNQCEYILCSNVGEYSDLNLPRLFHVKDNTQEEWLKSIDKIINLPNISDVELNNAYTEARKVKFDELRNISNIVNSIRYTNSSKIIEFVKYKNLYDSQEFYNFFINRYTSINGLNLNNITCVDFLKNLYENLDNIKSIFIEDLIYLEYELENLIHEIKFTANEDFVIVLNNVKYSKNYFQKCINYYMSNDVVDDYEKYIFCRLSIDKNYSEEKFLSRLESLIYKKNADYINSILSDRSVKFVSQIKFLDFDTFIINL